MPVQAFVQAFPASSEMLVNLMRNFDHWSAVEAEASAAAAAVAAAAAAFEGIVAVSEAGTDAAAAAAAGRGSSVTLKQQAEVSSG